MAEAPIVQFQEDLTRMLLDHPAPWRFENDERNPCIFDGNDDEVDVGLILSEDDDMIAAGIVAAVNIAAAVRP